MHGIDPLVSGVLDDDHVIASVSDVTDTTATRHVRLPIDELGGRDLRRSRRTARSILLESPPSHPSTVKAGGPKQMSPLNLF
jgi:hypothetical protein